VHGLAGRHENAGAPRPRKGIALGSAGWGRFLRVSWPHLAFRHGDWQKADALMQLEGVPFNYTIYIFFVVYGHVRRAAFGLWSL